MRYIVVGAGPAGVIGAETLRKADPEGKITLIGEEDESPYSRMAIPYLLHGNIAEEGTFLRKGDTHYTDLNIETLRNNRVAKLDAVGKTVELEDGRSLPYDKLLIATGSRPTPPPVKGVDQDGVQSCWTLQDARAIKEKAVEGAKVVLIGAGFIGTIALDALASRKVELTVIEAEERMVPRMIDDKGSELIKKWCDSKGVRVLTSTRVNEIAAGGGNRFSLKLSDGSTLDADLVITATGVTPNIEFMKDSGVEIDMGVLVNDALQSSHPDIYAAGDVAQGPDFSFAQNAVHAIQPTAAEHARIAALNMAGKSVRYRGSLSMNTVDTMGLLVYSFGKWMGTEKSKQAQKLDEEKYTYRKLVFEEDVLVGAIIIGHFEHIGVLRGMIQNRIALGEWKDKLMEDPGKLMAAYLMITDQGLKKPPLNLDAQ